MPNMRHSILRINLLKLLDTVNVAERRLADELAAGHGPAVFAALPYTEKRVAWILLRKHATQGQIDPSVLKRMRTADLEYLAGVPFLNPTEQATEAQVLGEVKVVENAVRAGRVLARRATFRSALIAAIVGALVGALTAALVVDPQEHVAPVSVLDDKPTDGFASVP